jgi:hypothetical protein
MIQLLRLFKEVVRLKLNGQTYYSNKDLIIV